MSLLSTRSPARERIYEAMLAAPTTAWTVRSMWEAISHRGGGVSVDAIRPNLCLLFHDRLVDEVPGQRTWTVRLTRAGVERLSRIRRSWRLPDVTPKVGVAS